MLRNRASAMILILEGLISTMKKITEAEYQGIKNKDLNALRTEVITFMAAQWVARNSLGNEFNALLGQKNAIGPGTKLENLRNRASTMIIILKRMIQLLGSIKHDGFNRIKKNDLQTLITDVNNFLIATQP
uniref:Uncharacterized protein n=1 Tax=Meloidogyne enterolobii TaxID=390850 RepID=A0A6V7TYN3_MELEN|nr:unnamed protein product [Meloidogyne enterolobii]